MFLSNNNKIYWFAALCYKEYWGKKEPKQKRYNFFPIVALATW